MRSSLSPAAIAALLALTLAGPAVADDLGAIAVPEQFPELPQQQLFPPLIDPAPVNGSWAVPDAHPLGITLDNYNLTQEQIDAARRTGCKLVRLSIPMEHFIADASPDWAVLDQVVSRLERAGFEVMPVLDASVAVPEFYRDFCRAVAARYAKSFRYYQLLDNINYKIGLDSQGYADLANSARLAITMNDGDAEIVSGGIRGADLTYVQMLASQGALSALDVLAFDLYPPPGGIEEAASGTRREHCLPYMEDIMQWAQQNDKRVWVTSLGISTSYNWVGVDQPSQASMYARGALYLGWIGVERIIFAAIQDSDPTYQDPARCCGLLDVSGAPKASFYAMQALNRAVDGAYHVQAPFLFQGFVYERPQVEDMVISPNTDVIPGGDQLAEFRVHSEPVYGFWFYAPSPREYRFVYWLGREPRYPALITLNLGHIGLTPVDRYILLDNGPSPVTYQQAQNFLYLPYLPLDEVPGVIRFEVNEHGGAS
jgi:hypothetical protein